jgi:xyloglucan-specific exo-beta-1,4-glucanase
VIFSAHLSRGKLADRLRDPNNGTIARSSDKGETWEVTTLPFKVGGNMPGRGTGERLAVDPKNSQILLFGARSGNGLWKSTDGGATFAKLSSFEAVGTFRPGPEGDAYNGDLQGLTFVTFDETSEAVNGATSRIFVGTADNTTASVYVSTDAGATWSPVADQPAEFFPHKARLSVAEKVRIPAGISCAVLLTRPCPGHLFHLL